MEQSTHTSGGSESPLLIVTIPDGPDLLMESAFLAGAGKLLGLAPQRVAADFGIDVEAFQASLAETSAAAVILPYVTEFRDALLPLAARIREAVRGPVVLIGDGLAREHSLEDAPDGVTVVPPDGVTVVPPDGVTVVPGDPGMGLVAAISGDAPRAADHAAVPLDLTHLGPGLAGRPLAASLFGEMATVALSGARAARSDLSPTAAFARWQAPVGDEEIVLPTEVALTPLQDVADGIAHVEWWDRDATDDVLAHVTALAERASGRLRQSVRCRITGSSPDRLAGLRAAGVHRVVFEVDRVGDAEPLPGSNASVDDLGPWFDAAREESLEVGVVLAVGLPGETRAAGRARADRLLELRPDRVRCVPFEPTGGTPAWKQIKEAGMLLRSDHEMREVHRPLLQDSLSVDDYWANWTDALCTLAHVEGERTQ